MMAVTKKTTDIVEVGVDGHKRNLAVEKRLIIPPDVAACGRRSSEAEKRPTIDVFAAGCPYRTLGGAAKKRLDDPEDVDG